MAAQEAAQVTALIQSIGEVTLESEPAIVYKIRLGYQRTVFIKKQMLGCQIDFHISIPIIVLAVAGRLLAVCRLPNL